MKSRQDPQKTHYQSFAQSLELQLQQFRGDMTKREWRDAQLEMQNQQVVDMMREERAFVDMLASQPSLHERVFRSLLAYIKSHTRLQTAARPYVRERNLVFVREVMPAVERGHWNRFSSFALNWAFLGFAWALIRLHDADLDARMRRLLGQSLPVIPGAQLTTVKRPLAEQLLEHTAKLKKIRDDLVVTNMPLVVDRASAFERATPWTPLVEQMDHISVATEGLLAGIDKVMIECRPASHWRPTWHPVGDPTIAYWRGQSAAVDGAPFEYPEFVVSGYRVDNHHTADKHVPKEERPPCPATVFRTTAIGRMGGRLIGAYSQTHMHLGPDAKRLLYQCNKVAGRYADSTGTDFGAVAEHVLRDRVAWTLGQRFGLNPRQVAFEIDEAMRENDGDWGAAAGELGGRLYGLKAQDEQTDLATLDPEKFYDVSEETVVRARKHAPSRDAVAGVMLACSTVSTIDDEGEDRLNEAASYSAPTHERPDVQADRGEERWAVGIALNTLSILEKKVLVLLGLTGVDCLLSEAV